MKLIKQNTLLLLGMISVSQTQAATSYRPIRTQPIRTYSTPLPSGTVTRNFGWSLGITRQDTSRVCVSNTPGTPNTAIIIPAATNCENALVVGSNFFNTKIINHQCSEHGQYDQCKNFKVLGTTCTEHPHSKSFIFNVKFKADCARDMTKEPVHKR